MRTSVQGRDLFPVDQSIQKYNTAIIVRWVVFTILVLFAVLTLGAYAHAMRRIRRGHPPKAYHRWMVRRHLQDLQEPPLQNQFSFYRADTPGYDLEAFPPPAYDPNHALPPTYQPHAGASKVNTTQDYNTPPSGPPPPSALRIMGSIEERIGSSPPTARSVRSPWLSKFKRST